jgi:CheY-like chemotaxis protein
VLVIEDDPDVLAMLAGILELEGLHVRRARNGREALVCFLPTPPSLVLVDLIMPVMDGWEFTEQVRRRPDWAQVPIVLLSGDEELLNQTRERGVTACLLKPFELDELVAVVRYCLSQGAEGRPSIERSRPSTNQGNVSRP